MDYPHIFCVNNGDFVPKYQPNGLLGYRYLMDKNQSIREKVISFKFILGQINRKEHQEILEITEK